MHVGLRQLQNLCFLQLLSFMIVLFLFLADFLQKIFFLRDLIECFIFINFGGWRSFIFVLVLLAFAGTGLVSKLGFR